MPPKAIATRRPVPQPTAKPIPWVAKRKKPSPKKARKTKVERKEKAQTHNVGGNKFSMYVAQHKPHIKVRKKKSLTDRQILNFRKNQERATNKLLELGFEFNMLTGKFELAQEFGV